MAAAEQIRNFITAAEAFRKTESNKSLTQLQRHIKILYVVSDLKVFSSDDQLTCDFYLCLHRLLASLGVASSVTWLVVRLLEHLCTNPASLKMLRDRYCFLPVVAGLLTSRPEGDRTALLLNVAESLTAELTLERYEPFVRPLLRVLSDLVCEHSEPAPAALRVLNQLVRAGPVLTDSLLAAGHRKRLAGALVGAEAGPLEQLHAAELLLAVQARRPPLPLPQLHSFVDLVFSALAGGLAAGDVRLMAQAARLLAAVLSELTADGYGRLAPAVRGLLEQMTTERYCHAEYIFRPLETLVRRGAGNAEIWRPVAVLASNILDRPDAAEAAAALLDAALQRQLVAPDGEEVAAALRALHTLLEKSVGTADPETHGPLARAVTGLLNTIVSHAPCRAMLAGSWRPQLLRELLRPLPSAPGGRPADYTAAEVVVATLELARALGSESASWLEAHLEMVRDEHLLAWLGRALVADDRELVQRALRLLCGGSLPTESVQQLGESLADCQRAAPAAATVAPPYRPTELSHSTAERVDTVLARLRQEQAELKDNVSMVDVMELYEFKVASLSATVAELEEALQSASSLNTSVRLQVAQASAEGAAVRRLLVAAERRVEALRAASKATEQRAAAADVQLVRLRDERTLCQRETQQQHAQAQRLERELAARTESLRAAQQTAADAEARRARLAAQVAALTKTCDELRAASQRQEATLQEQESRLQETTNALQQRDQEAAKLRNEVSNLELLCKSQEQSLAEKERECADLLEDNRSLRKIQDMIHSISSKSKEKK